MPVRFGPLVTREIYHLYNRTVGNEEIFLSTQKRNTARALEVIDYYRFPQELRFSKFQALPADKREKYQILFRAKEPLVEIYAYALMPNHYHLLLRQMTDAGIRIFTANFQNSLAKFYNLKIERRGTLFVHPFKARRIETDEDFIHIYRYIHLNPVTSYLFEPDKLIDSQLTSYNWYMNEDRNRFISLGHLMGMFKSRGEYRDFVTNQAGYQRELQNIKRLTLE